MKSKTTQLKDLLLSDRLEFLLEAHSGMSARIVEDAGFKGIWASGLCISAVSGVRDCNELSWTQVLEIVEYMSDATEIPILIDADTGYGNFNNVRRLIGKLEQRQIAGICIEDKTFPKTNSYIQSETQPLADVQEFCGKISAAKDVQKDPDFCVVARTEAFVTGRGILEALRRAQAYHSAGADAILVHSKSQNADEVLHFMKEWDRRCPIVIVPTSYSTTPTDVFRDAGISIVIWANQIFRASLLSMQNMAKRIMMEGSVEPVDESLASLSEVFRLQSMDELHEAEKRYLPQKATEILK